MALALDQPMNLIQNIKLPEDNIVLQSKPKSGALIKNHLAFELILKSAITLFNKEAIKEFLKDLSALLAKDERMMKEIFESVSLQRMIFELGNPDSETNLFPFHKNLLLNLLRNSQTQQPSWKYINGTPQYQIELLNEAITFYLNHFILPADKNGISASSNYVYLTYFIEDILNRDFGILSSELFLQVFCKLVILLDKADFLYTSLPAIELFDERFVKVNQEGKHLHREGGILRILLKIAFLIIKYDSSLTTTSSNILSFLIFRGKEVKKLIKSISGFQKDQKLHVENKKKSQPKSKCNMLDIVFKNDPSKMKQFLTINEFYAKKIIINGEANSDSKKSHSPKKSFFEEGSILLMHIFCEIFHLLQFELYGITSFMNFPSGEALRMKTQQLYETKEKPLSPKFKILTKLIDDIVKADKNGLLLNIISVEFEKVIAGSKGKFILHYPANSEIKLGAVYSSLDIEPNLEEDAGKLVSQENNMQEESLVKIQQEGFNQFRKLWNSFAENFTSSIRNSTKLSISCEILISILFKPEHITIIQPYMQFIATHSLAGLEKFLLSKNHEQNYEKLHNRIEKPEEIKFFQDLQERIKKKFGNIAVPKNRIERDELRQNFDHLAESLYNKLYKEQQIEDGVWFNKKEEIAYSEQFKYIEGMFKKLINRCTLHDKLTKLGKDISNKYQEFVTLCANRDSYGRGMILKRLTNIEDRESINYNFGYLRQFLMKKALILSVASAEQKEIWLKQNFVFKDFKFPIMNTLFMKQLTPKITAETKKIELDLINNKILNSSCISESDISDSASDTTGPTTRSQHKSSFSMEEYIPRKIQAFETEMITIKGAIFGRLTLNSICLSFKSEERIPGNININHRFGSPEINQINEKINKKWKLSSIKEVVIKRYNLIRQAVEVYFESSKSMFFSLYSRSKARDFLKNLKKILQKNESLHIDIVDMPERYFAEKKFREKWMSGKISNFEYLMLLNKYGGRSFNDLCQYPVFPWIIKNYTIEKLNLADETIYRSLGTSMGAISKSKRIVADEKLSIMIRETDYSPYQFAVHYLPGRVVLGYMLRTEPYASLLIKFEGGHDAAPRMFHSIKHLWDSCMTDKMDNRELIPEFFYLPEMFGNFNMHSYGTKNSEDILIEYIPKDTPRVILDQVVLPLWAKNHHIFIKENALALENPQVSLNLDKWIDLIFGDKQQDPKSYNRFKEICDEEIISRMYSKINDSLISEIQEFGSNPIKLFRDKHCQRQDKNLMFNIKYSLSSNNPLNKSLVNIHTFSDKAISYISASDNRVIVVLNSQTVHITADQYINAPHDKSIIFKSNEIPLFPYKKLFIENSKNFLCEPQRSFSSLDNGNYVITCRHFDNTCKIINCKTGEVKQNLIFHFAIVNSVYCTKDEKFLFTGSADGVLAKWNIDKNTIVGPNWFACDHTTGIISLDACHKIGLVISVSIDGKIIIRSILTGKFVRQIKCSLTINNMLYEITHIRLSYRGYVVIIAKAKDKSNIIVYSINNESICSKEIADIIQTVIISENGYEIITGSKSARLMKYDLLTLEETDLFQLIDYKEPNMFQTVTEFVSKNYSITAMEMTKQEGIQQLLIGLNSGAFYTYKYSTRLIGDALFAAK